MGMNDQLSESVSTESEVSVQVEDRKTGSVPAWQLVLAVCLGGMLLAMGVLLVLLFAQVGDLRQDVKSLEDRSLIMISDVAGLSGRLSNAENSVGQMANQLGLVAAVPEGSLPQHNPDSQSDLAVGRTLGEVTGVDWATKTQVTLAPTEGTATLWMLAAHWCPHCQYELPVLAGIWETLPHDQVRTVVVSTSQDPSQGNPEEEWLTNGAFPYEILIDSNNQIATQFGLSAFPFWVITDSNGVVMGRFAGRVDEAGLVDLYENMKQLNRG